MTATLAEVALRTGMSRSLASLALRGDDGVSAERRAQAVRAADALGLPVGALARRRADGAPLVLGVVVTEGAGAFHGAVLRSAIASAAALGLELRVVDGDRDEARLRSGLAELHASAVSTARDAVLGLVVLSSRLPSEALAAAARDVPVAVVGSSGDRLAGLGVDTVRSDEESGMHEVMMHLAALGHVRTCFVAESRHASTTRRAHEHAVTARRLWSATDLHVDDIAGLAADPTRIARHLGDGVTAFVAANDSTAARLVASAREAGLRLPGIAAVTGFDDTAPAAVMDLTTVEQPRDRLGARAVELVVERLRGRRTERHEVLPTRLVTRGSTTGVSAPA